MRSLQFPKFSVNVRAASLYEEVKMRILHTGHFSRRTKEVMKILFAFLWLASVFSCAVFAEALVRYVTPSGGGARNGVDWSNALGEAELHDALAAVNAGGETAYEFRIAQGTYRPSLEMNRNRTFLLKKNVALYGGFAGNETDRDQRDWRRHTTILTGDLAGDDLCVEGGITVSADCVRGANSNTVVTMVTGADATTILDGFVVTGGNASVSGGGCTSAQGSPVIRNCVFVGNAANNFGGGMYTDTGSPMIETCLFFGNRAGDYGGGFYTHSGKPVLSGCLFSDNTAGKRGGGAYTSSGQPILARCTFSGNTTVASSGQGGAFFNESGSPLLKDCTLRNNLSARGGGAASSGGNFSVESSHFMANASSGSSSVGGAFFLAKGTLDAVNTTFTGNRASSAGGAVYEQNGTLRLRHCTLVENIAGNGGGLYILGGTAQLRNTILWSNDKGQIRHAGTAPVVEYCIVEGNYGGTGNSGADPLLDTPNWNGGPTRTCALLPESAAVARGISDSPEVVSSDQRGVARPEAISPDIGAYQSWHRKILTLGISGTGEVERSLPGDSFTENRETRSLLPPLAAKEADHLFSGVDPRRNSLSYEAGSLIALAVAAEYIPLFDGWSGDVTGTSPSVNLLLDRDRYVRALFAPGWLVIAEAGQGGTITPSGRIRGRFGEKQRFAVSASPGYRIDAVFLDQSPLCLSVSVERAETHLDVNLEELHGDHTLCATFSPLPNVTGTPTGTPTPFPSVTPPITSVPSGTPTPPTSPSPPISEAPASNATGGGGCHIGPGTLFPWSIPLGFLLRRPASRRAEKKRR